MKTEALKDIVSEVINNLKNKRSWDLLEIWEKAVSKKIAQHTKPVYFHKGILVINVDKTSWLFELNLFKPILMRKIKKINPTFPLEELKFRIGKIGHG